MTQNNKQKKLQRKNAKRKKLVVEQKKKLQLKKHRENIEDLVENALTYVSQNRPDYAKTLLDKLSTKYPNESLILYGYGLYYLSIEYDKKGISFLQKSIEFDPKFAYAYINLSIAYYKNFQLHKMMDTIHVMFKKAKYEKESFGIAEERLISTEKLIKEHYDLTLEKYCDSQRLYEKAYNAMLNSDFKESIILFTESLKILPDHVQSFGNIGICFAKLGDKNRALKSFDAALLLDPEYELAIVNKAIVEQLKEGVILGGKINSTEYYKDYSMQNKSYIDEVNQALELEYR